MATYVELRALMDDNDLENRCQVACIVAAGTIQNEDPGTANHDNRLAWAEKAYGNPAALASKVLMAVLAANKDQSVANITGATDAQLQTKVDEAINVFAQNGV
jgi:pyruvate/2-oxoacid:ferredoxin oxidoreductase beta subunit